MRRAIAGAQLDERTTVTDSGALSNDGAVPHLVVDATKDAARSAGFRDQIYKAISVQRPVVLEYLKSLRREKPDASVAEILRALDRRYVATVTATSTGVGMSAAIPAVGIPVALSLGVADLLFFYETSALYVLSVAELHGIEVSDVARAQPLVFGMLLGEKSQVKVSKIVLAAVPGSGGVDQAKVAAAGVLKGGWGEVLTEQLPDSAMAPVMTVLAREALKVGGKLGAKTVGKVLPFGVGAVLGGVGSFTFGQDVVKASRLAFTEAPKEFPVALADFERSAPGSETSERLRAVVALQSAAGGAAEFGSDLWGKVAKATDVFRSVDLDGDGIPDEARALTAAKNASSAVKGAAVGAVVGVFRRKHGGSDESPEELVES